MQDNESVRSEQSLKERLEQLPQLKAKAIEAIRRSNEFVEVWHSTSVADLKCQHAERWDGMS